ncbi:hypothetical protein HDU99_008381, partial [Rhizoclosmatium hyalinum]
MSSEMETDSIVETGDEELGTHFTSADLESTAKVLAALNTSPALKRFAKTNSTLRDVLALGHRVFRPSDDEKKSFVKKQKKNLRDDDLKLLDDAGIRKMRLVKMVGMIGGSVDLQKPPRIANPEDVDKFIAEDEAKTAAAIKAEAEKLMQQP